MTAPEGVKRTDVLWIPPGMIEAREADNYTRSNRGDIPGLADSIQTSGVQNPLKCRMEGGRYVLVVAKRVDKCRFPGMNISMPSSTSSIGSGELTGS